MTDDRTQPEGDGLGPREKRIDALRQACANIAAMREEWMTDHIRFTALMDKAVTEVNDVQHAVTDFRLRVPVLLGLTDDELTWVAQHLIRGQNIAGLSETFEAEYRAALEES